ncbi:response regulator [Mucilaginibacter sp. HMF5004]|uniref:response regulator n=1 Tax=Mucilaginibacter rivuli TaxID=2857527 RepID=UPI001C5E2C93|nr:response regulator [Mucilaginibacter rivuli]MBW4889069.1 response regulator [Mucilaginibacter rivuli]
MMYKALVIDDDPIFQYIAEKIFKKTNLFIETGCFLDARSALDFLDKNKENVELLPDIILLDLYMPSLSGWEFLNRYDEMCDTLKKKIPVYILTSSVDPKEIARSKSHPSVKAFTSKPMTFEFVHDLYRDCKLIAS